MTPEPRHRPDAGTDDGRWPFAPLNDLRDPMQPGDHEPARLPEDLERAQDRSPTPKEKT